MKNIKFSYHKILLILVCLIFIINSQLNKHLDIIFFVFFCCYAVLDKIDRLFDKIKKESIEYTNSLIHNVVKTSFESIENTNELSHEYKDKVFQAVLDFLKEKPYIRARISDKIKRSEVAVIENAPPEGEFLFQVEYIKDEKRCYRLIAVDEAIFKHFEKGELIIIQSL